MAEVQWKAGVKVSLDLTIVPYEWGPVIEYNSWLAYTRLRCGGARGFSERLEALDKHKGPKLLPPGTKVTWYGDEGLEERTEDPYGDPLTYMTAGELLQVESPQNDLGRCAWAYLAALPRGTPVILWWH